MTTNFILSQYLEKIDNKLSIITGEIGSIKHLAQGWSTTVSSTYTELGTDQFGEITLPSANTALQISSSVPTDTNIDILVQGYDDQFNFIEEVIATSAISGQTPVTLANQYFRIRRMVNQGTQDNLGDIYLSIDGSPLAAGVPTLQTNYIYSMSSLTNQGSISNVFIPPFENGAIRQRYVLLAITQTGGVQAQVSIQRKPSDTDIWITELEFRVNILLEADFQFDLSGRELVLNNDLTKGQDYRLVVRNSAAGTVAASGQLALEQI